MTKVLKIGITDYLNRPETGDLSAVKISDTQDNEPDVWFSCLPVLARTLVAQNLSVLNTIREARPDSIEALAEMIGRRPRAVLEMLQIMERHGLVRLHKQANRTVRPEVKYDSLQLIIDVGSLSNGGYERIEKRA
jgi:predicted transcriptional regulator